MKIKNKILVLFLISALNSYAQTDTSYTYKEYIAAFSSLIANNKKIDSLYFYRSWIYFTNDKYDSALLDINKAIKLKSNEKWYYDLKGDIFNDLRQYDSAINSYNRAIKIDSSILEFHGKKIQVLMKTEQYLKAIHAIDRARINVPIIVTDEHLKKRRQYLSKPLDSIYHYYESKYKSDTSNINTLYNYGYCAFTIGKYNISKHLLLKYKKEVNLNSYKPIVSKMLGVIYFRENDIKKGCFFMAEAYILGVPIPNTYIDVLMLYIYKELKE